MFNKNGELISEIKPLSGIIMNYHNIISESEASPNEGWKMYSKIHQLKEDKLRKLQVAKKFDIDYKTVTKYWNMNPQEYAKYQKKTKRRTRKLDKYKEDILIMLKTHSDYKVS